MSARTSSYGCMALSKKPGGAGTSGSCRGFRGRAPNVTPNPMHRSTPNNRAMFARSADELAKPHGFELIPGGTGRERGQWPKQRPRGAVRNERCAQQGEARRLSTAQGTSGSCQGRENRGGLRARTACLFAQCRVVCGSTYLQYAFALIPCLARKICAALSRRSP